MNYYVYILRSKKDSGFYVGMTKNLEDRLGRHNSGRESSTKARIPFEVVLIEEVPDRKTARIREKYWKSGSGREKIRKIMAGRPASEQV